MSHTTILSWVTFVYFGCFILYLFRLTTGKEWWGKTASGLAWFGLAAQTLAFAWRWKASYDLGIGHVPLANLYESLIFFAWAIMTVYLVVETQIQNRTAGVFIVPLAFLAMSYASIVPGINDRIEPLVPALQSNWLTTHVVTCFLGYAAFTVAFGGGLLYLIKDVKAGDTENSGGFRLRLPSIGMLDALIYKSSAVGFVFLTMGIMTGAVWAHYAWGSYWNWDPKETWSLITWLIYAMMLHARFTRGWNGKRLAWVALIGFAAVLFTYLGVNYFSGLHSYIKASS